MLFTEKVLSIRLLCCIMERKFSSYAIEKACRTDIRFMWLLQGEPVPSVATLKRFQSERLGEAIEGLFYQFVEKLYEMGEVKFKNLFVNGTKIEAYANKYTFVWKKATEKTSCQIRRKDKSNIKEALKNKKRPAQTQRNIAFELALFC